MCVFVTFFVVLLSQIALGAAPSYSISCYGSSEPIEVENVSRFHFKRLNDYRELRARDAQGTIWIYISKALVLYVSCLNFEQVPYGTDWMKC